jgi:hypothetical protein
MDMSSLVPTDDDYVTVRCKFSPPSCVHLDGDIFGQLRGQSRADWKAKQLRPHAMQLAALRSVSADRILTGNMQGIPGQSAAQRLSSDQRTALRKGKTLFEALQNLGIDEKTKDWVRAISMKPASVVIVNESTPSTSVESPMT